MTDDEIKAKITKAAAYFDWDWAWTQDAKFGRAAGQLLLKHHSKDDVVAVARYRRLGAEALRAATMHA